MIYRRWNGQNGHGISRGTAWFGPGDDEQTGLFEIKRLTQMVLRALVEERESDENIAHREDCVSR
jgi:hypothetical protein